MTILVADSGSTKTDWVLCSADGRRIARFASAGINPCLMDDETIAHSLTDEVVPRLADAASDESLRLECVYFYGAGCRPDQEARMCQILSRFLGAEKSYVASDLLGAAHALCGRERGIVAILGTGSGSALYDGNRFVKQTPSLGYILGDEGSGAVLGRRFLGALLKNQFSAALAEDFEATYHLTTAEIIQRVYREAAPNRFLAQFALFLLKHLKEQEVHDFVVKEFRHFFDYNIAPYDASEIPVHFVGSVACSFRQELEEAASLCGFKIGKVLKSPIGALADFCLAR